MQRYINCMIHVRHICYQKITFCFTETLMDISKRTSSSTSASEDVISDTRIRRSTCAYAEAWWTDLRITIWTLIKETTTHQHLAASEWAKVRTRLSSNNTVHSRLFIINGIIPDKDLLNMERMLLALKRNY